MTQDEIIEMARLAALDEMWELSPRFVARLEAFAKLVEQRVRESVEPAWKQSLTYARLDEREACAKVCDESAAYQKQYLNTHAQGVAEGCAISIRARGEQHCCDKT